MLEKSTIRAAVEFAVQTEAMGRMVYTKIAEKFAGDAELKEAAELLAKDEALHENQFRALLGALPKEERAGHDERFVLLRAMSLSEFFAGEKGLYDVIEKARTRNDVLLAALGLERASLQYYQVLADILGEQEKLAPIIRAEQGHIRKLMQYLLTDAKFRGISDGD